MRIVIVDDHPMMRQGLEHALGREEDLEVVGSAGSVHEGLEVIASQQPDLVILDLRLPDHSGLELIRSCKKIAPGCRFLILSAYSSSQEVFQALSEQVGGYILKDALPEEVVNAVRLVGRGRRYFVPQVMEKFVEEDERNRFESLTAREKEILHFMCMGLNNSDIAKKLNISDKTVKKHVYNLMGKLGVQDRVQAVLTVLSMEEGGAQNNIYRVNNRSKFKGKGVS